MDDIKRFYLNIETLPDHVKGWRKFGFGAKNSEGHKTSFYDL